MESQLTLSLKKKRSTVILLWPHKLNNFITMTFIIASFITISTSKVWKDISKLSSDISLWVFSRPQDTRTSLLVFCEINSMTSLILIQHYFSLSPCLKSKILWDKSCILFSFLFSCTESINARTWVGSWMPRVHGRIHLGASHPRVMLSAGMALVVIFRVFCFGHQCPCIIG